MTRTSCSPVSLLRRLSGLVFLAMLPLGTALAEIHVSNPWSLPLPPTAVNGAAYLTMMNQGADPVRLTGATTDRADSVEIHTHVHENGQMSMKRLADLELAPGESAAFAPGGLHLMLLGLTQPMVAGEQFTLTLEFDEADSQTVNVLIGEQPASGASHEGHNPESHNVD